MMVKVLFVCMGNICRSPTAHGVLDKLVNDAAMQSKIQVDSAGTQSFHAGEPPDPRARETALRYGVDLSHLRARAFETDDFVNFDYIVAMDERNLSYLRARCPAEHTHKLSLLLPFAPQLDEREVPDPYYGGRQGFERVFELIDVGARAFLEVVIRERGLVEG